MWEVVMRAGEWMVKMLEVGLPGKVWDVGWVAGEENTSTHN